MPPKKKQKTKHSDKKRASYEDPEAIILNKLSLVVKDMARLTKQRNQFKALIKQIFEITEQPESVVTLTKDNQQNLINSICGWLNKIESIGKKSSETRDHG